MRDLLAAAFGYIDDGFRVVPIPYGKKGPRITEWQALNVTPETAPQFFNGERGNIGVILGHGDVADVDLDCSEAIASAGYLLPPTATFGHKAKPGSHLVYKSPGLADAEERAARKYTDPVTGGGLLELRTGGGGFAAQTVFPPSVHPSGEVIAWTGDAKIATVQPDTLRNACARLAACALLARYYPKEGARHDGSLVLGGVFAGCGIAVPHIKLMVEAIGVASGQPRDKIADMRRTAEDGAALGKRAGFPKLVKVFGKPVAERVAEWLGYKGGRDVGAAQPAQPNGAAVQPESLEDHKIARLAKLGAIDYDRERKVAADQLGVRVATLDKIVAASRPAGESSPGQGRSLELPEPEPWPEQVNSVELLAEIEETFARFIVCDPAASVALALWTCATWFEPVAQVAPILNVTSPEPRCGKTVALSIAGRLVKKPLPASNISPAAVFRTIEKYAPTLIIDEADAFLGENEELRGLINSGHTRDTAFVVRTVGNDHEPRTFSTWGFKALAGIGRRAATIEDRAITISLKRKLVSEKVDRLRYAPHGLFEALARKLARFAADNMERAATARPELPEALNDRAADNWELSLAIAEISGGEWPERARQAAIALSGGASRHASKGEELLRDVKDVIANKVGDHISGAELVERLLEMPDRPWGDENRGRPISPAWLARRLGRFEIEPKKFRDGTITKRGYEVKILEEAFDRYIPAYKSGTNGTSNETNDLGNNKKGTEGVDVPLLKPRITLNLKDVPDVPVLNPESGPRDENGANGSGPIGGRGLLEKATPPPVDWGLDEL
jgi:Protein of unknown function (DUF3631)/Bifunctional DNA primase/polymerase, N-terminal